MRAMKKRCRWAGDDPLMIAYHDEEWGRPEHDERRLFEFLILEGAQAGLSWRTILHKREAYRRAYDRFDIHKVARYGAREVKRLVADEGIVRNRLKVEASIGNARAVLALEGVGLSLDALLWSFADGKPRRKRPRTVGDVPATTPASDAMSKALKARGFRFVGSTICYALMQACGLVDDHTSDCDLARR